ncbi:hypothetical protein HDV63DRAFT_413314 [Trichoderma sp. SZMC 28014]
MALMPPSDEERELYYYGLPSCPKLVARSSSVTKPWVDPQMPGFPTYEGTLNMHPRVFLPAKDNPLLSQQWNDATSSLRIQILEAVSVADWAAIDILRVGLDKDNGPDGLKKEFQNTLLIAVVPDSMSWQEGHSLALRCKAILEEHGIDMHCEIRESVVTMCADADSNAHIQLSSKPITGPDREIQAEISDLLGTKIAMKDSDYIGGTKGLYLELPPLPGGERRFAVLTCRHVAAPTDTGGLDEYCHTEGQPPKEAIQVDQPNYKRLIQFLETVITINEGTAESAKNRGQTHFADVYSQLAEQAKDLQQVLKTFETPSSRVFGHLLYSPKPEYTSDHLDGAKWYRDWALIELLPSRHQAEISSLRNKVFVGTRSSFDKLVLGSYAKGWDGLPRPQAALVDNNGAVELQKVVVPISEFIEPIHTVRQTDGNAIFVAKYGAKTGLTLGLGNKLKSVLRRPDTPGDGISEEWCITAANLAFGR